MSGKVYPRNKNAMCISFQNVLELVGSPAVCAVMSR